MGTVDHGAAPSKSLMAAFANGFFSDFVYEKTDWDLKTFSVDAGLKAATEKTAQALNATDPDLKPFQARGGKLILYHGWNDPAISALNTVNYYESVIQTMGQKEVDSFARLYMVPGMQHCEGGPGADSFGQVGELKLTIRPIAWMQRWNVGWKRGKRPGKSLRRKLQARVVKEKK